MLRIGQVETTATSDSKYTDGSVAGGVAATRLRAAAFNAIQEELANIVESAALTLDVNDTTQVLTGLKKLFLSRSNPFADIKADGSAAIATALSNLGLGTAAQRNVGTGTNQIPDMSAFAFLASGSGYTYLPNSLILQWGLITTSANEVTVTLPIICPNAILNVFAVSAHTLGNAATSVAAFGTYITSGTRGSFTARGSISTIGGRFWAIGY